MLLIPVKYHKRKYPSHIEPEIDEIAGHFDVKRIFTHRNFSLHTEYSYGKRKLNTVLLNSYLTLKNSHNGGIPQLWHSDQWALEFAYFVKSLCNSAIPTIIEIHPPFSDYTKTIDRFLEIYKIFEESILSSFPECKILIENRSGSMYKGGKFIISRGKHIRELCNQISKKNLKLRIALDIPQLFTAYGGPLKLDPQYLENILNRQNSLQSFTDGIHLWGKRRSVKGRMISHSGDLTSYFEDHEKKEIFLKWIVNFLKDGKPRYFVPEVNSSDEDLHSIINDLEKMNIKFG